MTDEVMFEIREMTGQTYRDHYAGEVVETSTDVPVIAHPASVTDDVRLPERERELVGVK
jgi:hypothetical protein